MADALGYLGLARKAGRLLYGMETVEKNISRCTLLLLAENAGDAAARNTRRLAQRASVPLLELPFTKEAVGHAVGRALCSVCALTDRGLAEAVMNTASHPLRSCSATT